MPPLHVVPPPPLGPFVAQVVVNKWRGEGSPPRPSSAIDELIRRGIIEQYELIDAKGRPTKALRVIASDLLEAETVDKS